MNSRITQSGRSGISILCDQSPKAQEYWLKSIQSMTELQREGCIYTMLDVHSRWAFALPKEKISTWNSLEFVEKARLALPFNILTLQSDHGPEFSKWFTKRIVERDMSHRHSRVRTPNDNAHLERFNRTIQDECLRRIPRSMTSWEKEIPEYLRYYNNERPHMALDMKSPVDLIKPIPSY